MRGRWTLMAAGLMILHASFAFHQGLASERYTVKPGDSLYGISKSFGVTLEALRKANSLQTDEIRPKQGLLIPNSRETDRRPAKETESYVVKKGDNLFTISKSVGLSVDEIMKANRLRSASLKIGQTLILSKPKVDKVDSKIDSKIDPKVDPEEGVEEIDAAEEVAGVQSIEGEPQATPEPAKKWGSLEERDLLVKVVKTFLGAPYRLGGATIKGIDCSAFVKKIYEIFNIRLPRTVREQVRFGKKIEKDQLAEGDLVFFKTLRGSNGHVGIYIGNNEFVHASYRSREVKVDNLSAPYFNQRFFKAVRVKELESEFAL
jgi:peptidoglycan DL-endopeptidase LytE